MEPWKSYIYIQIRLKSQKISLGFSPHFQWSVIRHILSVDTVRDKSASLSLFLEISSLELGKAPILGNGNLKNVMRNLLD